MVCNYLRINMEKLSNKDLHPPPFTFYLCLKIRWGGVCFRFFLILAPVGGSKQTSFLTLQGILHVAPTLQAVSQPIF